MRGRGRPKIPRPAAAPPSPVSCDLGSASLGCGSRIMDMENLQGFLTKHTCCKSCAELLLAQQLKDAELLLARQLKDFATHVDEHQKEYPGCSASDLALLYEKTHNGADTSLKVRVGSHKMVAENHYGAASVITLKCPCLNAPGSTTAKLRGGHYHSVKLETSQKTWGRWFGAVAPMAAQYVTNLALVNGMIQMGRGQLDLYKLMAYVNIPVTQYFTLNGKGFSTVEKALGESIEAVTQTCTREALEEELELTEKENATAAAAAAAAVAVTTTVTTTGVASGGGVQTRRSGATAQTGN